MSWVTVFIYSVCTVFVYILDVWLYTVYNVFVYRVSLYMQCTECSLPISFFLNMCDDRKRTRTFWKCNIYSGNSLARVFGSTFLLRLYAVWKLWCIAMRLPQILPVYSLHSFSHWSRCFVTSSGWPSNGCI